jgi:predicted  nucleic acid-binding Zn ribbon protein
MYKQKISILINSKFDRDKLYDEFEMLMGNLCKTGQVLGNYETPFITANALVSYQTTLETTSLSKKYFDEYSKKRVNDLEQWCNSKLKTEVVGKVIPEHNGVCKCKKSDFYILFTYAYNNSGLIDCGNCKKVVPIYRLTQLAYNDRYEMLSWETNYKACDNLQLGCTVGEKWATKQMSDVNSQLSKQGIDICKKIMGATGVATFYYLHNYRHISPQMDKARLCPSCNGKWLLKQRLLDFYDFKCDKCMLLSSFSPVTN